MNNYDIKKLRELPIEGVAERLGMKVTRHKALCPFHDDKHPSLSFSVSRNTYKCFVCDAHGGVIDLAMKVLGKGFPDTCEWLANGHDIIIEKAPRQTQSPHSTFNPERYARYFEHPFINDLAADFLYSKRRLDPRVIRWCKLNSYKEWLQIPYFDMNGKMIGIQSRYLGEDKNQPRFRFPSGNQCHIYNQQIIPMLREGEPLYIAEGCSDCWAMLSAGHKAIAIPSATLLREEDIEAIPQHLSSNTHFHMFPDQDVAGESVYRKLAGITASLNICLIRHQLPSGCKDFSDYYLTQQNKHIT